MLLGVGLFEVLSDKREDPGVYSVVYCLYHRMSRDIELSKQIADWL